MTTPADSTFQRALFCLLVRTGHLPVLWIEIPEPAICSRAEIQVPGSVVPF